MVENDGVDAKVSVGNEWIFNDILAVLFELVSIKQVSIRIPSLFVSANVDFLVTVNCEFIAGLLGLWVPL